MPRQIHLGRKNHRPSINASSCYPSSAIAICAIKQDVGVVSGWKNGMNSQDNDLIKARVRQWMAATPVLQEVRDKDIQHADTARAMKCFSGAVLAALPKHPPQPWSGLVEQQKFFRKLRTL